MMNCHSVVAVVLSSIASFWLAGCAADASSPTGDEVVAPAGDPKTDGAEVGSEFGNRAHPLPAIATSDSEGLDAIRFGAKRSEPKGNGSGCDVGGEVECSCGVCAPISRCVAICETIPQ